MVPGLATLFVNDNDLAELLPQAATDLTVKLPLLNAARNDTSTEVVPCPDTMDALAGAVHKYDVAPVTAVIE